MCRGESIIKIAKNYSPVLGVFLGIFLSLFFTVNSFVYLRDFEDFMGTQFPNTPSLIISLILILICAYVVKSGIEVVGRLSALLILPVLIFVFAGIIISSFFLNYAPIYQPVEDYNLLVKGILDYFPKTLELLVLITLMPFLNSSGGYNRSIIVPLALNSIIIVLLTFVLYGNFDIIAKTLTYKLFELYREVARADSLFIFVWVSTFFVKISLFLYASAVCLGDTVSAKDWKVLVFPISLVVTSMSILSFSNYVEYIYFYTSSFAAFELVFAIILPVMAFLSIYKV
jgi:spore germination protein KB